MTLQDVLTATAGGLGGEPRPAEPAFWQSKWPVPGRLLEVLNRGSFGLLSPSIG